MRHYHRAVQTTAAALVVLALASCGGADDSSGPDATGADGSPSSAPSLSPSTTPSPTSASLGPSTSPSVCTPSTDVYRYSQGQAQLNLSGDVGEGQFVLELDTSGGYANHYLPDDGGITLNYSDAQGHFVTFNIGGISPAGCTPDTFTSITVNSAQTFIDPSHTQCAVHVAEVRADGIDGSYECVGLTGGGAGLTIDAFGFFSAS